MLLFPMAVSFPRYFVFLLSVSVVSSRRGPQTLSGAVFLWYWVLLASGSWRTYETQTHHCGPFEAQDPHTTQVTQPLTCHI